jgi:hypothetical protein
VITKIEGDREMAENTEKVRGNPILPDPPVPSIVRQSMVPEPPAPITKDETVTVSIKPQDDGLGVEIEEELDVRPKGMIVIKVFENSPYEVEFSGKITGSEVDIAWKAMMKEYRVWKHNLFKKETEQKSGGV